MLQVCSWIVQYIFFSGTPRSRLDSGGFSELVNPLMFEMSIN